LGPGTYVPQKEVRVVHVIKAIVLLPNQALQLRARKALKDYKGEPRKAGEEWLVRKDGAYLPDVDEIVIRTVSAYVLTDKKALHLKATASFIDAFKRKRRAGEEWLITSKHSETHIPDVYEAVIGDVNITSLTKRQWCIIENPVKMRTEEINEDDPMALIPQLGKMMIVKGETNFFLHPGERIGRQGIREVYVLGEDQALLVSCLESFEDTVGEKKIKVQRKPGERWILCGPLEYWPPKEIHVVRQLSAAIKVEALHLNIFQPEVLVAVAIAAVLVPLILYVLF